MKNVFRTYAAKGIPRALISFLYAFGVALPLCRALTLPVSALFLALPCLCFTVLFSLLSINRPLRMLSWALTIVLCGGFIFLRFSTLVACFRAFSGLDAASRLMLVQIYAMPLSISLCFVLSRLVFSLCTGDSSTIILFFSWGLSLLLILLLLSPSINPLYFIPLLLSILLAFGVYAPWQTAFARVLIPAALCLAAAAALLPSQALIYEPFSNLAQRTRNFMEDYFFFTQSRTIYSLQLSGYQPYGREQMGGPINPTDDPVMEVETPAVALMRGVVKNEYTGAYWQDTTSANRYLFVDPRFQSLRRQLFDLDKPSEEHESANLLTPQTLNVRIQKSSASTLFTPARTRSLSSDTGIVPYFGPSSEMFATRDLAAGDSYSVLAPLFTSETPGLESLVQAAQDDTDPYFSQAQSLYGSVSSTVEDAVYQLAYAITQDASTPFKKATALCDFLRARYAYTYDQSIPPEGRDFVSWFLLEERQGYCVSYASAMAVMGRIVGLPTRYVEGYVAYPDADGIARVTEKNAHAWVEIYFSGFGWVPFDPTAGSNTGEGGDGGVDSPINEGGDASPDSQTPSPGEDSSDSTGTIPTPEPPDMDDPTPSPDPTPTPTPTPEPGPQDTPEPSPQPDPDEPTPSPSPSPTPTPQPEQTPTPTPPIEDPPEPPEDSTPPYWLLLLLLLVLLAIARAVFTQPSMVAKRVRHPRRQLLVYYRAILLALSCMNLKRREDESPLMHARRVQRALDGQDTRDQTGITRAAYLISRAQYSLHVLQEDDVSFLQTVYTRVKKRMTPVQRLRYALRLITHGIGNDKAI